MALRAARAPHPAPHLAADRLRASSSAGLAPACRAAATAATHAPDHGTGHPSPPGPGPARPEGCCHDPPRRHARRRMARPGGPGRRYSARRPEQHRDAVTPPLDGGFTRIPE